MIKGLAFASVVSAVRALRGDAGVEALLAVLPSGIAQRIRQGEFLVAGWYPVASYCQLLAGVRQLGGEALLREIGATGMRADLTSIHRLVLKLLSASTLISVSQRMFPRYFTLGKIELLSKDERSMRVRYFECKGWSRDMWVEQFSGAETFLQLAGLKAVSVRPLLGGREGDTEAVIEARWS
jgi:hypothetical protein